MSFFIFFFNDTATTEIYTLSLHDALPILWFLEQLVPDSALYNMPAPLRLEGTLDTDALERSLSELVRRHEVLRTRDRKSTRLNSSHANISYAVFCLKKKNQTRTRLISIFH